MKSTTNEKEHLVHVFKSNVFLLVIIIGNISVGKTSITERIMEKEFKQKQATVGVEFSEISIKSIEENVDLSIQIWDTCKFLN